MTLMKNNYNLISSLLQSVSLPSWVWLIYRAGNGWPDPLQHCCSLSENIVRGRIGVWKQTEGFCGCPLCFPLLFARFKTKSNRFCFIWTPSEIWDTALVTLFHEERGIWGFHTFSPNQLMNSLACNLFWSFCFFLFQELILVTKNHMKSHSSFY